MPIIFDKRCDNILISDWKISADLPEQSLYKSDPKRLNPNSRIFTRQPDIDRAMDSVSEADIGVSLSILRLGSKKMYFIEIDGFFNSFLVKTALLIPYLRENKGELIQN